MGQGLGGMTGKNNSKTLIQAPFITLADMQEQIHIVKDQFLLRQIINSSEIINHVKIFALSFEFMKDRFQNKSINFQTRFELKLHAILNQIANTLNAGMQFLPQAKNCRMKRDIDFELDKDVVGTSSLFPSIGKLFHYLTGTLDSDAGKIVNLNYNNIKKLTRMSVTFASMFNASLNIQQKHENQLRYLLTRVKGLDKEIEDEVNELNLKLKYRDLLQNMVISAIDLEFTVNKIFDHSDKAENDLMGALAKDQVFIDTILSLMDHDTGLKRYSLYLMKLASEITVEKCGSNIIFSYIFPILDQHEYRSMRIYNVPKLVNRKFFQSFLLSLHLLLWVRAWEG